LKGRPSGRLFFFVSSPHRIATARVSAVFDLSSNNQVAKQCRPATMSSAGMDFAPGRLCSLWGVMFNFHLFNVVHLLWQLDFYERNPLTPRPVPSALAVDNPFNNAGLLGQLAPFSDQGLSEIDKQNAKDIVETAKALAKELDLRSTSHRIETLKMKLRFSMKGEEYKNEIRVLREALNHDFKECFFYHYPREKADMLLKVQSNWKRIWEAFPDAKLEAMAAYDCYALNHNTAGIFHIMRVAERGLRALAKERKVSLPRNKPIDWATWQEIIKELSDEATKIGLKAAAGAAKDSALSFYSGAISDLNAFKDEYRNQVMHVRKDYDEYQALRALVKVQAFMEHISERMDYRGRRIRWGLKFRKP
jgi:hypothetical protein